MSLVIVRAARESGDLEAMFRRGDAFGVGGETVIFGGRGDGMLWKEILAVKGEVGYFVSNTEPIDDDGWSLRFGHGPSSLWLG